jgi:inorganic pyrophosphatase
MSTAHPWHDILPGPKAPQIVKAVIEIAKGSRLKYELDKPTGMLMLDRVLFSAVHYPANYGLIPQTYYSDHDPLDIIVICSEELMPLSLLDARVIGVMHMEDNGDPDDKIVAVAANDISLDYINDIGDLPPHTGHELKNFFEDYKKLENKKVDVLGFKGKETAFEIVDKSIERYHNEIKPTLKNN